MTSPSSQETAPETSPSEERQAAASGVSLHEERLPERAEALSQQAAQALLERAARLREQALERFEQQRDRAADTLDRLSHAFGFVGSEVQRQDESMASHLERTGQKMRDVAGYVASASPTDLAGDLTRLARTRPTIVAGGAFLAGAMLGRFLRASQGPTRHRPVRHRPKKIEHHQPITGDGR